LLVPRDTEAGGEQFRDARAVFVEARQKVGIELAAARVTPMVDT
jgi:hypothetical protein